MTNARWPKGLVVCIVLACAHDLSAQVPYLVVADLSPIGGRAPMGGVVRGVDGALYGTTSEGGVHNCGLIYRLDAAGMLSVVHSFSQPDGCRPVGELALGPDGALYGVTSRGGDLDPQRAVGTVYKIGGGGFTVLHRFILPVEVPPEPWLVVESPAAGLLLGPDGFFYGTTLSSDVYRISPDGAFALVDQYSAENEPQSMRSALILGADGLLYGTSPTFLSTAPSAAGTIYRLSLAGESDVVRHFRVLRAPDGTLFSPEGALPAGELTMNPSGEIFGANSSRGPNQTDRGTLFRLDPGGTFTILHAFAAGDGQTHPDGAEPVGGLIHGSDGFVYGKTVAGGAHGNGTIFRISRDGILTTLRSLPQDGYTHTSGRLHEAAPGVFFGTASSPTGGIVYRLTPASTPLTIALTTPVGGEKVFASVPATIEWTASGATRIDVGLSRDGGRTFTAVPECTGLAGSIASCTWTPGGPPAHAAQIKVVAQNDAGTLASDTSGNIRISTAAPLVNLLFPLGGLRVKVGTTLPIWWLHNLGERSSVAIELSRDGGATWEVVAPSVQNAHALFGVFNWTVTGPTTHTAFLRVTSLSTNAADASHRPFTIVAGRF